MTAGHQIDPDDLDEFRKQVLQLADRWVDSHNHPSRLTRTAEGDPEFPRMGVFREADELHNSYVRAMEGVFANFDDLYLLLEGLARASKRIAESYREGQELGRARLRAVERILDEQLDITPPAGSEPGATGHGAQALAW